MKCALVTRLLAILTCCLSNREFSISEIYSSRLGSYLAETGSHVPVRWNHNWTDRDRRSIHSANLSSDKREPNMTDTPAYTPPEVWVWEKDDSPKWRYGNINRPVAGATHEKELARGKHPLQLYSLASRLRLCWRNC